MSKHSLTLGGALRLAHQLQLVDNAGTRVRGAHTGNIGALGDSSAACKGEGAEEASSWRDWRQSRLRQQHTHHRRLPPSRISPLRPPGRHLRGVGSPCLGADSRPTCTQGQKRQQRCQAAVGLHDGLGAVNCP